MKKCFIKNAVVLIKKLLSQFLFTIQAIIKMVSVDVKVQFYMKYYLYNRGHLMFVLIERMTFKNSINYE